MRFGLIIAGTLAVLGAYSGYWFWLADRFEEQALNLQTREQENGNELAWADMTVTGYPYHIRTELEAPSWQGANGASWHTDTVVAVHGSPTDLSHVIIDAAGAHEARAMGRAFRLQSESLRVSVADYKAAAPTLFLDAEDAQLWSQSADQTVLAEPISTKRAKLHFRAAPDRDDAVDVAVDLTDMYSPIPLGPGLGQQVQSLKLVGRITELAPSELNTLAENPSSKLNSWAENGGIINLSSIDIALPNDVHITGKGRLHAGRDGYPAGTINATISGYDVLLAMAVQSGQLSLDTAQVTRLGLDLADKMDGRTDGIVSMPLTLAAGGAYIGPMRLTSLPKVFPERPVEDGDAPSTVASQDYSRSPAEPYSQ